MLCDMSANVSLAYVGLVVPDAPEFENRAFSRAATIFQLELLKAVSGAGLRPDAVVSFEPIESFPRSSKICVRGRVVPLGDGIDARLVSFLNITPLKQLSIGIGVIWHLCRWRWATRKAGHHVIFCYNLTVPPGVMLYLASRVLRAKLVAALYDINVPGQTVPVGVFNCLDYWMQMLVIPRLDGFVVACDEIMKDFAPGREYVRVEAGMSAELLKPGQSVRVDAASLGKPVKIVVAARLDEANGIRELLQAISKVREEHVRLCIAGAGPLADEVKKAAAGDARIEYLGFLSYKDVLTLYRTADLLINMRLTKRLNTKYFFPSKMMEYLASGIPVISTCTGHVEKEYGSFCYLLRNETAEGLASLIEHVVRISPQERFELGCAARAYVLENKTWEVQGRRIAEHIRESAVGWRQRAGGFLVS
jgi:glycosyltransferase involved in cell wall biosynthesis